MRTSLLIHASGDKQIIFTPQSKQESEILKVFSEENLKIMTDCSFSTEECKGGYYRKYNDEKSVVLVLRKDEPIKNE